MNSLRPIRTAADHKVALARIDQLMTARAGTPEGDELELLAILVERYESKHFPITPPTPLEAIKFRMEQMGYTQADLAKLLGSRSRASEILSGSMKRLSLSIIRKLHERWHIPADVLIGEQTSRRRAA